MCNSGGREELVYPRQTSPPAHLRITFQPEKLLHLAPVRGNDFTMFVLPFDIVEQKEDLLREKDLGVLFLSARTEIKMREFIAQKH